MEGKMEPELVADLKQIIVDKFQVQEAEDMENIPLADLGLDSLDALDFLYQIREKYDLNIPKNIENKIMSLCLKDFVPYLTRLQA